MGNARSLADNLPLTGATGNRNIIINGAMNVSQRHGGSVVSVAPSDHYVVDRFKIQDYSDATFNSQHDYDGPAGFTYCSKLTVTGTDTSLGTTQYQRFLQPIEGYNMRHLKWGTADAQTVTLSFYVKSSLTGTFSVFVFNNSATRSFISTYTISAANTWERKTVTITGDTTGTWEKSANVGAYIGWSLGTGTNFQTSTLDAWDGSFKMAGTSQVNFAGTNGATWQVTGVQLELGTKATEFENEDYQATLAKCQRYFFSWNSTGLTDNLYIRSPYASGTPPNTSASVAYTFPVTMRAAPTMATTYNFSRFTASVHNAVAQIGSTSQGNAYATTSWTADAEF